MKESLKFLSPALFLLVALCFFLPFVSFTCQGQKLATITGMELVTGTKIEKFNMQDPNTGQTDPELDEDKKIDSEPLAVAALIFALAGIVISLIPRYSKMLSVITGILGALMLLFLRSSIGSEITGDFEFKIIDVSYEWGYYLALILFFCAFAANLYLIISENKIASDPEVKEVLHSEAVFCPKCGTTNKPGNIFCEKCGHTLTS
jgi:hypothetical protein